MIDYKKKYMWKKIRKIEPSDADLFTKMFYLNDIEIKIVDDYIYAPWLNAEIVGEVIDAHYSGKLSVEYYKEFELKPNLYNENHRKKLDHHLLKMIGPIILVFLLLMFIKAIFGFNIV